MSKIRVGKGQHSIRIIHGIQYNIIIERTFNIMIFIESINNLNQIDVYCWTKAPKSVNYSDLRLSTFHSLPAITYGGSREKFCVGCRLYSYADNVVVHFIERCKGHGSRGIHIATACGLLVIHLPVLSLQAP